MRIEGLQVVRNKSSRSPHNESLHSNSTTDYRVGTEDVPMKRTKRPLDSLPNVTSKSGCDLEVSLVERGHDFETDFGMGNWLMDSFRLGLGEPVCCFLPKPPPTL